MIGENIIWLRKRRGLTLTELAERANISKSYLSNIERNINQNPSIQILERISQVLDTDVNILIDGRNSQTNVIGKEWVELIEELQKSGIKREDLKEYKPFLEFIKWKKEKNIKESNTCSFEDEK